MSAQLLTLIGKSHKWRLEILLENHAGNNYDTTLAEFLSTSAVVFVLPFRIKMHDLFRTATTTEQLYHSGTCEHRY